MLSMLVCCPLLHSYCQESAESVALTCGHILLANEHYKVSKQKVCRWPDAAINQLQLLSGVQQSKHLRVSKWYHCLSLCAVWAVSRYTMIHHNTPWYTMIHPKFDYLTYCIPSASVSSRLTSRLCSGSTTARRSPRPDIYKEVRDAFTVWFYFRLLDLRAWNMNGFGKVLKQHVDTDLSSSCSTSRCKGHWQNSSLRQFFFLSVESNMKQVLHLLQPHQGGMKTSENCSSIWQCSNCMAFWCISCTILLAGHARTQHSTQPAVRQCAAGHLSDVISVMAQRTSPTNHE